MRAQAEQTGAAPQPIRRAEGPEPGLPARASQGPWRGGGSRAGDWRDYSAIKHLHSRDKPGLSTVEAEPPTPKHPQMMQVRADGPPPPPTCGKGSRRGGGAEVEAASARPQWRRQCQRSLGVPGLRLQNTTSAGTHHFSTGVCLLPSPLFPLGFGFSLNHTEERARRDSTSEGRKIGLFVQGYTHRLGRAWSLLHPIISPQRSK